MWRGLQHWPLLLVGAVLVGWSAFLADRHGDTSGARALLAGVGCIFLGVGLAEYIRGPRD